MRTRVVLQRRTRGSRIEDVHKMNTPRSEKVTTALERFIERAGASLTWILPGIGSLLALWLLLPFLMGEQSIASDELFHQSNQNLVKEALEQGRNPAGLLPVNMGVPGFRTYQGFHALVAGTIQYITGIPPVFVHNWLMVLLFAASPFAYRKLYLEMGLHPIAAGAGGLLCISSVGGFTNSFEAYFRLGVVTQSGASVLLPLALAALLKLIKHGSHTLALGVLMGLTTLAHAMYSSYAAFGSLVIVLVLLPKQPRTWYKLGAAALLAVVLSAAWLLPFIHMTKTAMPMHDTVVAPHHNYYSNGLSPAELGRFLYTGRLFDGAKRDGSPDDRLEAVFNQESTLEPRFPFLTVLALLGLLFAIIRARDPANRILIAGFSLGLLFLIGVDDVPLFAKLPLLKNLQYFRMTHFTELFAFGLGGLTVFTVGTIVTSNLLRFLKTKPIVRIATKAVVSVCIIGLLIVFWASVSRVVTPYLDVWDVKRFDKVISIFNKAGPPDPHQRVLIRFKGAKHFRKALNHAMEVRGGYRTACQHWAGTTTILSARICREIGQWYRFSKLARMAGIRYGFTEFENAKHLLGKDAKKSDYRLLGRYGRHGIFEDRRAAMLHSIKGKRVLVVSTQAQWYWLVNSWLKRWVNKVDRPEVPWLLHAPASYLGNEKLLSKVDAVMYLDDSRLDQDLPALKSIEKSGKPLALATAIKGVNGRVFKQTDKAWHVALGALSSSRNAANPKIRPLKRRKQIDRLSFQVTSETSELLMFSMQYFKNWHAFIDGKPAPTMATGPDMVSIIAPSGKHRIDFSFESMPIDTWSMTASGLGWLGVICFSLLLGFFRLRKRFFSGR